jgi:plastocyanin
MTRLTITALATLALALGACGGSDDTSTSPPAQAPPAAEPATTATTPQATESGGEPVAVSMKDIKFVPAEITAKIGQKIVWTNREAPAHNVTATSGADFESETLSQGERFEYTPSKAGKIDYVCTIHPGQTGAITVTQ